MSYRLDLRGLDEKDLKCACDNSSNFGERRPGRNGRAILHDSASARKDGKTPARDHAIELAGATAELGMDDASLARSLEPWSRFVKGPDAGAIIAFPQVG